MLNTAHSTLLCEVLSRAQECPDKIALAEGEVCVTYSQLLALVEQVAGCMCSLGLSAGDPIVLVANKELPFVYCYLAAHSLGIANGSITSSMWSSQRLCSAMDRSMSMECPCTISISC